MNPSLKVRYLRLVRSAFRTLRHRHLWHRPWWRTLARPLFHRSLWIPCATTVSTALSIGLFFSMLPIPFQMFPAALVAVRFRANIPFAMAACWVTNPFTQVPIILVQFRLGQWLREILSLPMPGFLVRVDYAIPGVGPLNAASFTLGFLASAVVLAILAYPITKLVYSFLPSSLRASKQQQARAPLDSDESSGAGFVP